jgi:uncharacterized protein (DUF4415 family)
MPASKSEERIVRYKPEPLTKEQVARLKAAANLPDEAIDFSDIPETTEQEWASAVRGGDYRPTKQQLTLRLDSNVVDWFKRNADGGKGYQTAINQALRDHVEAARKRSGKKAG